LSQPLPLSPPLPSLDGRPRVPRDRPAEGSERSAQRQAFSRMLDRFAQSDRGQEADRDPVTAPQDQRPRERCGTADDSPRSQDEATDSDSQTADPTAVPAAPIHSAAAPAEPATPAPDPAQAVSIPAPSPTAVAVPTIAPPAPAVSNAAASATTDGTPATSVSVEAAMPVVAAAGATAANGQAPVAAAPPAAAATPTAVPAEPVADSAAPQAAADTPDFADVIVETTRTRRMAMATGAGDSAAKAAKVAQADKAAAELAAPQSSRLPAAPADVDTPMAANSNQGQPQFRIIKADTSTAVLDAAAGVREDRANAQSGADQVVASLTSIDSPRRTVEIYHKVAEAARPGADAPTPVDQVSIRLLHAVADGKRAIQMHLHPADLGSIDVKMQWQGDKLTAQFTVDRPETLQILQREVPALERSLGQAGVNVDSGSLSFSLRQQQGNGKGSGEGFDQAVGNAAFGDGGELATGDEPLGQVIRDGILSIRV
jgi:flagellar hook-length control protein FliK